MRWKKREVASDKTCVDVKLVSHFSSLLAMDELLVDCLHEGDLDPIRKKSVNTTLGFRSTGRFKWTSEAGLMLRFPREAWDFFLETLWLRRYGMLLATRMRVKITKPATYYWFHFWSHNQLFLSLLISVCSNDVFFIEALLDPSEFFGQEQIQPSELTRICEAGPTWCDGSIAWLLRNLEIFGYIIGSVISGAWSLLIPLMPMYACRGMPYISWSGRAVGP